MSKLKPPVKYDKVSIKYASPETIIAEIQAAWEKYGKENVSFECIIAYEYGDEFAEAYLQCAREENEEEKELRQKHENDMERYRRTQYEALKKEFEK